MTKVVLEPPPAKEPLPSITWTNSVRTVGACPHDVIYGSCNCDQPTPGPQ